MRPMVLMIGADKGGVGKTMIARTVLDYLDANDVTVRAQFDLFARHLVELRDHHLDRLAPALEVAAVVDEVLHHEIVAALGVGRDLADLLLSEATCGPTTWNRQISGEYDRIGLIQRLTDKAAA